jgi:hypothetical protein
MSFFLAPGLDAAAPLDPGAVGLGGPCPLSGHTGGVGSGLTLEGSMGSSFLDMDGMFTAAGCGMPSAHNFLLPDELPSPLDGAGAVPPSAAVPPKPALLPPTGGLMMLPLHEEPGLIPAGAGEPHHGGAFGPADGSIGSMYSDYTAGGSLAAGGASTGGGSLYGGGGNDALQSAAQQQRRMYHLVLVSPDTGAPVRTATEDDAAAVARMLESESGCSALSVAGAGLPRALSFVGGSGAAAGRSEDGEGEEVRGGGGCHDLGDAAKRQRTGKAGHATAVAPAAGQQHAVPQERAKSEPVRKPPAQQQRRAPAPKPAAEKRTGPCTHCGVEESPQWRKGPSGKPVLCNACGTRYRRTHQLGPPIPSSAYRTQGSGGGAARRG